jgi:hypothetical protein
VNYKLVVATVIALSLAACSGNSRNSTSEYTPGPEDSNSGAAGAMHAAATTAAHAMAGMAKMTQLHKVTIVMNAQNGSGESGVATLLAVAGDNTSVTIQLNGENTTGKQPAHIHVGPCTKLGAVKYPLSDVVLGKSVTIVDAPLGSLTGGNLAVNVHESAADIGKYVSCGNIAKPTSSRM